MIPNNVSSEPLRSLLFRLCSKKVSHSVYTFKENYHFSQSYSTVVEKTKPTWSLVTATKFETIQVHFMSSCNENDQKFYKAYKRSGGTYNGPLLAKRKSAI